MRSRNTAACLAADEFILLLEDVASQEKAVAVADRVLRRLRQPFHIAGRSVQVGVSIGIALSSEDLVWPHALLQAADRTMYGAKQDGTARFSIA